MQKKGLIIVLSAPSGAGKSTIYKKLLKIVPNLTYSISTTTRCPRKNEVNGRDYFFAAEPVFKRMVRGRKFVEWAKVHGNYYGTSKEFIEKTINSGKDVILDIDVQGGMQIKKAYPSAVLVFVMAPSFREIEKRLKHRNKDSREVIALRLRNARKEVRYIPRYDYLVINDDLHDAVTRIKSVIAGEHLKTGRSKIPKF